MAAPIYKLFLVHLNDAWYQLADDERNRLLQQVVAAREAAGGEVVAFCNSSWSSEHWTTFGVEKYPSIDAVQAFSARLAELNWLRYVDSMTLLGTDIEM